MNLEFPTDDVSLFEGDFDDELSTISAKLTDLEELCSQLPLPLKKLNRIQALGNNLFHRLTRIEITDSDFVAVKTQLDSRMLSVTTRMDQMVRTFKSSFELSPIEPEVCAESSPAAEVSGPCPAYRLDPSDRVSHVYPLNHKFNGKDSVHAFLEKLGELCLSRHISVERL